MRLASATCSQKAGTPFSTVGRTASKSRKICAVSPPCRAVAMPTQPPFHSAVYTVCRSVMTASGMYEKPTCAPS